MPATRAKLHPISAQNGGGDTSILQQELQDATDAFPYLEKIGMVAKKSPYAMLTIIVSIASVVIIAVTTVSISIIGSVFVMYGKMSKIEADQTVIIRKLEKSDEVAELTGMKADHAVARQNYLVGLMDEKQQGMVNDYDRANPAPKPRKKDN